MFMKKKAAKRAGRLVLIEDRRKLTACKKGYFDYLSEKISRKSKRLTRNKQTKTGINGGIVW